MLESGLQASWQLGCGCGNDAISLAWCHDVRRKLTAAGAGQAVEYAIMLCALQIVIFFNSMGKVYVLLAQPVCRLQQQQYWWKPLPNKRCWGS